MPDAVSMTIKLKFGAATRRVRGSRLANRMLCEAVRFSRPLSTLYLLEAALGGAVLVGP